MDINFNFELRRKFFHCASIIFPIIYLFTTKLTMIIILMICTGIALSLDISRHYEGKIQDLVDKIFSKIMRPNEKNGAFKLSGVSYMFLGFFITCLLFSKGTAISAFLVLIISDTAAAIVGQHAGKTFHYGKSIEGAAAFFLTSFLIGLLSYTFSAYNASFFTILLASAATTFVEYNSNRYNLNDNLAIPVTYGMVISILGFFI
jgi:dolichol kinase